MFDSTRGNIEALYTVALGSSLFSLTTECSWYLYFPMALGNGPGCAVIMQVYVGWFSTELVSLTFPVASWSIFWSITVILSADIIYLLKLSMQAQHRGLVGCGAAGL